MARKTKLTNEEEKIENEIAKGEWRFARLSHKELAAVIHESKDSRINLRLSPTVLEFYKREAERVRVPYQTLINQVLERFAMNGETNALETINQRLAKIESLLKNQSS